MTRDLYERDEQLAAEGRDERQKENTERANDGNEIEIYLESSPLENFRVCSLVFLAIISMQSVDIRGILLVSGRRAFGPD